jgi:hypothetical protein
MNSMDASYAALNTGVRVAQHLARGLTQSYQKWLAWLGCDASWFDASEYRILDDGSGSLHGSIPTLVATTAVVASISCPSVAATATAIGAPTTADTDADAKEQAEVTRLVTRRLLPTCSSRLATKVRVTRRRRRESASGSHYKG